MRMALPHYFPVVLLLGLVISPSWCFTKISLEDAYSSIAINQLAILQLLQKTQTSCEDDSPGYVNVFGKNYLFVKTKLPWFDAREYCLHICADLATPPADTVGFAGYLRRTYGEDIFAWLGGRLHADGRWLYVGDGNTVDGKLWSESGPQPDGNGKCLMFASVRNTDPFYDRPCDLAEYFVCERK